MKIIIGADICIQKAEEKLNAKFISGDAEGLVSKGILDRLNKADFRVYNLEGALTDNGDPLQKCGPCIKMDPRGVAGIKALKADLLTIANNHVVDLGQSGFEDTLKYLNESGIKYIGGGMTIEDVKKPFILEKDGKKIGFYTCCEHEFSWFSDYGYGTNGFDPFETLDELVEFKKKVDFLIVLYHGGREYYRYAFPYLQKTCRKIVEKGADLVVCQHTHCIGSEEDYKGAKIVYGQGNFIFCKYAEPGDEFWASGMLVEVNIEGDKVSYDYIPYTVDKEGIYATDDPSFIDGYKARSEELKQEGFVEKHFAEYADGVGDYYPDSILNSGRLEVMMNYTTCEPHRQMLDYCLKKKIMAKSMKK